ncbi:hypothetical protein WJ97_14050 [Burkholderia ubonensis]|uniref:SLATT domain-containing protein n=1 Tax=Burkholderia ubonensis TaxID=101571 RepID=UPI000757A3D8|nr:SLATT domain-containing protein [Burkholderia ubonensis]KVP96939.1 hypothetical protein WJ97_14050 [Burkholderia ubonensis]
MDQPSPPEDQRTAPAATLEGQLREMYGRAAYTHKTHEKMADRYFGRYRVFKGVEIVLSAITTSSLLLAVFGDSKEGTIVGAVCSTILLGVALYFKEAGLTEKSQKHTEVASRLWAVREALLSLLVDLNDGRDTAEIRAERDRLNEALEQIYASSPRTDGKAYAAAQTALKDAEELFFTDAELDKMLPKQLRKS